VPAQPGAPQDSTLDNLVDAEDCVTTAAGTLGAVVERGKGPIDMVLGSGFGVGASVFEGFTTQRRPLPQQYAGGHAYRARSPGDGAGGRTPRRHAAMRAHDIVVVLAEAPDDRTEGAGGGPIQPPRWFRTVAHDTWV
jgi:hypothetical protein